MGIESHARSTIQESVAYCYDPKLIKILKTSPIQIISAIFTAPLIGANPGKILSISKSKSVSAFPVVHQRSRSTTKSCLGSKGVVYLKIGKFWFFSCIVLTCPYEKNGFEKKISLGIFNGQEVQKTSLDRSGCGCGIISVYYLGYCTAKTRFATTKVS